MLTKVKEFDDLTLIKIEAIKTKIKSKGIELKIFRIFIEHVECGEMFENQYGKYCQGRIS